MATLRKPEGGECNLTCLVHFARCVTHISPTAVHSVDSSSTRCEVQVPSPREISTVHIFTAAITTATGVLYNSRQKERESVAESGRSICDITAHETHGNGIYVLLSHLFQIYGGKTQQIFFDGVQPGPSTKHAGHELRRKIWSTGKLRCKAFVNREANRGAARDIEREWPRSLLSRNPAPLRQAGGVSHTRIQKHETSTPCDLLQQMATLCGCARRELFGCAWILTFPSGLAVLARRLCAVRRGGGNWRLATFQII